MVIKTTARLISKQKLSRFVSHFVFETKEDFRFTEGQFVNIIYNNGDDKPLRRAYSIASKFDSSSPKTFELCIKLEESGQLTPILFNAEENDSFNIMGPLGLFKLKNVGGINNLNSSNFNQLFIATGTGVAPMRALIGALLKTQNFDSNITLLFGARDETEILYGSEFETLQREYSNFNYIVTLSQPSESWDGLRGYVQDQLEGMDFNEKTHFYICGRTLMVNSVHEKLAQFEIPKENISHEKFG